MRYLAIHSETLSTALASGINELYTLNENRILDNVFHKKVKFISGVDKFSKIEVEDFTYLNKIYELELESLSNTLNIYHNKNISILNWEILLGPWLRIFVFVLYQKWVLINLIKNKNKYSLLLAKSKLSQVIPNGFSDFHELIGTQEWNDYIDTLIAESVEIDFDYIPIKLKKRRERKIKKKTVIFKLKKYIKKIIYSFYNIFSNKKILITGVTQLTSIISIIFIFFRVTPFAIKAKSIDRLFNIKVDRSFRSYNKNTLHKDDFQNFLNAVIKLSIPRFYLEDYNTRVLSVAKWWPKQNKFEYVFTSTSHWNDDFFKLWLSISESNSRKLIILQHGGTYGTTRLPIHQEYIEKKISDYYLTWGWEEAGKNTVPFISNISLLKGCCNYFSKKSDNILIISTRVKCYSKGDPWDSSLWNESYVENIIYTINRVNELFENNSLLRLHPSQNLSSESYYKFLKAKVINIRFDAEKNIEKSIFHSKLNIVTQNSTVLLQCLLWNLPVMAYWSEILSPLNNDAKKYFGLLEDVGIFHKNPKSLIDSISDIDIWWNSNKVQNARVKFCHKYINSSVNNVFSAMSVIKKRRKYTNE